MRRRRGREHRAKHLVRIEGGERATGNSLPGQGDASVGYLDAVRVGGRFVVVVGVVPRGHLLVDVVDDGLELLRQ